MNGIMFNVYVAIAMSSGFFILLILIESRFIKNKFNTERRPSPPLHRNSDVIKEESRIKYTSNFTLNDTYVVIFRDLTKHYKNTMAVNGITFGVKSGECFGLIGESGAGKTTILKMMTGEVGTSYGSAWINGWEINSNLTKVQQSIGYCPQFDALLDDLTPRDTMRIMALIRGVPLKNCGSLITTLSEELDFSQHLDKRLKHITDGNKRKLCVALALIGNPPVILLDEPSNGLSPDSKQRLWATLKKLRDNGKCIILTTQSMEECEALCTRAAVMVKGSFQSLGSVQSVKAKHQTTYKLIIKMKKPVSEATITLISNFIMKNFPYANDVEHFQDIVTCELESEKITLSKVFGIIEKNKKMLQIEEYSLGQSSLEQAF